MAVTDKSQNSETKNPPVVRQKGFFVWVNIGVPGIEPGLNPPHGLVLPVYYTP